MFKRLYECCACKAVYGTTFDSAGLRCPYCDGAVVPKGAILNRQEYKEIKQKSCKHKKKEYETLEQLLGIE